MYARQCSSTIVLGKLMTTVVVGLALSLGLPAYEYLGNQSAQADTLWSESFETNGQCPSASCRYTASSPFNDKQNNAYWDRGRNNNFNLLLDYVDPDGMRFWAAEAVDSDEGDSNATQTIDFNPINISPYTDLTVSALFATTQEFFVGGGFPWNQNNGEGVQVQYQIDGGGFQNGVWFKSNGTGQMEAYLALDTNFDGVGDTPTLTTTFTGNGLASSFANAARIAKHFDMAMAIRFRLMFDHFSFLQAGMEHGSRIAHLDVPETVVK